MQLPDGIRQIVATLLAAGAFLGLFFGATLVWWLALGLAVLVYGAALLIIARKPPASEVMIADRISQADLNRAAAALAQAGTRMQQAAQQAPADDRADLNEMGEHLLSIRDRVLEDPEDYRRTRRFVDYYLPKILETVEAYTDLARKSRGTPARLHDLGARIRRFGPVIAKIDAACLENDFVALEAEVEALGVQMTRA